MCGCGWENYTRYTNLREAEVLAEFLKPDPAEGAAAGLAEGAAAGLAEGAAAGLAEGAAAGLAEGAAAVDLSTICWSWCR